MKKNFLLILLLFSISSIYCQSIENIVAQKNGNEITVSYELSKVKFDQILNISLYVSINDGGTWLGPLEKVSGDIGKIESSGSKVITWDVLSELQIMEEELIFDVRAEVVDKKIQKRIFLEYTGNEINPFGARIGLLGKTGIYIEGRASAKYNSSSKYTYTNDLVDNYDRSGYYFFNGNSYYDAFSITAGITWQISRSTFLYGGAGYGSQKKIAEIDQYEYIGDNKIGNEFAVYSDEDYSGAVLSAGLIFNYKKFIFSAGGNSLNFQVFNFSLGAGILF